MKVIGVEFNSNNMNYVIIQSTDDGFDVLGANRITLGGTRDREALIAFNDAVRALFNAEAPQRIGIKQKPERGTHMAGAAALKMEGIVVVNSPCDVDFVSSNRVNKSAAEDEGLYAYLQPALKAAAAVLAAR